MADDGTFLIGKSGDRPEVMTLKLANRHGLVAGATGTGKTVTLQVMAEGFSNAGVPVFAADIKGDLSGIALPGEKNIVSNAHIKIADAPSEFALGGDSPIRLNKRNKKRDLHRAKHPKRTDNIFFEIDFACSLGRRNVIAVRRKRAERILNA